MSKTIFLKEVLEQMELKTAAGFAISFDIEVREFSAQSETGGKYKVYNDARLLISKPRTFKGKKNSLQKLFFEDKKVKNPSHFSNHTRNIELANGEIKKINIRFIIKFNGKKVIY